MTKKIFPGQYDHQQQIIIVRRDNSTDDQLLILDEPVEYKPSCTQSEGQSI